MVMRGAWEESETAKTATITISSQRQRTQK